MAQQETNVGSWKADEAKTQNFQNDIRYCSTDDGVSLAYSITGFGMPIVKVANWLSHIEYDWESPIWAHFLNMLSRNNRLLRYDERGNGLSDWEVPEFSFDRLLADLETIVDASGFEKFYLFGVSQGCAIAAAYAAKHPERVFGQVLYGGYSRGWRKRNVPEEKAKRVAMKELVRIGWGENNPAFRRLFASLFIPDVNLEQIEWYTDLQKKTTSRENAVRMDEDLSDLDVSSILPHVKTPSLILHCKEDTVVPFKEGQRFAKLVPNSRFVALPGRNHILLESEPSWEQFRLEVENFISKTHLNEGLAS